MRCQDSDELETNSWLIHSRLLCCRERLARAEEENKALRLELSALDPEFFEEVEDLKWEHHQLQQRAVQHEGLIAGLAAELGRAPPRGLGKGFIQRPDEF